MNKRDDQDRLQRLADAAGEENPHYVAAERPPGLSPGQPRKFLLLDLARAYVIAREAHSGAARGALINAVERIKAPDEVIGEGGPFDEENGWVDKEELAADGIELTCRCELPDGTIRHRRIMPTSIALERAERDLKAAIEESPHQTEVGDAVRTLFADQKEPFYSYRLDENGEPVDPAKKAKMEARSRRYSDVFEQLKRVINKGKFDKR